MNTFPKIPDPATHQRLLANLRQTRLEMEESNVKTRVQRSLSNIKNKS